ncbi:MAG: hypothetical protein WCS87_10370 [Methylococcaceae bacterium]
MLHPNQFQINEAWIMFKINDTPIPTDRDGDFNLFALMDAASCFILSSLAVSAKAEQPTALESKELLKKGWAHKQALPKTLFIPMHQAANALQIEAESQGITVARVPEDQLILFIGEAKTGFKERFVRGGVQ